MTTVQTQGLNTISRCLCLNVSQLAIVATRIVLVLTKVGLGMLRSINDGSSLYHAMYLAG